MIDAFPSSQDGLKRSFALTYCPVERIKDKVTGEADGQKRLPPQLASHTFGGIKHPLHQITNGACCIKRRTSELYRGTIGETYKRSDKLSHSPPQLKSRTKNTPQCLNCQIEQFMHQTGKGASDCKCRLNKFSHSSDSKLGHLRHDITQPLTNSKKRGQNALHD